jgi:alpha-methylacyl-CoA racemase
LEFAGIGPGPFCAMVLADLGADVVRLVRPGTVVRTEDVTTRSRTAVPVDLRSDAGRSAALALVAQADLLVEGYRPGVMERLGLGPETLLALRPGLVYGRMTGWGQSGPLAQAAGHDINYIAISGVLNGIGTSDRPPVVPMNLVGDFGGGGMLLAVGLLAALHEASRSGQGQVVDAAMSDGAALLSAFIHGLRAEGQWSGPRGTNLLDGGAHFYGTFVCADGLYIALGAIEPAFYQLLLARCGLDAQDFGDAMNAARWPALKARLATLFRSQPREHWCRLLEGTDACFAPVLDWDDAVAHPHNEARATFTRVGGVLQPSPAPRFSRSGERAPQAPQAGTVDEVLSRWSNGCD